MSKIEADRKSIPLFEVVEHIVGDLGQVVLQYEDIEESGTTQVNGMDFSDERAPPALVGNWEVLLPVDEATGLAWEGAWKRLSAAVRDGKLPVRGFRRGSEFSEEVKPEEFPELWHNRYSGLDFDVEYSGHRFLEFDGGDKATILNGHSVGTSGVIWAGLCAVSGAEVLKLWPAGTRRGLTVRESKGDETTERGFDLDAADLAEVTPRLRGDLGPPEVERSDAATTPTKMPSRKVLLVANELKKQYPDGLTMKTIADLARDLKTSESTVKRAFSYNGWSRTRAKFIAK